MRSSGSSPVAVWFAVCVAGAPHETRWALNPSRRALRTLFLLFALALRACPVSPYLAVPFVVAATVTIASARADDG